MILSFLIFKIIIEIKDLKIANLIDIQIAIIIIREKITLIEAVLTDIE